MKILVDADSCPVKDIIVEAAKCSHLPVVMFIDTCHVLDDGYSKVIIVDKGMDSVDIALINGAGKGDIVVTGDYGVAALALARGAYPLTPMGRILDAESIDSCLFERHMSRKVRRGGGRTGGPRARTREDDMSFKKALLSLCASASPAFRPGHKDGPEQGKDGPEQGKDGPEQGPGGPGAGDSQ
jgi:uncharacterized protein